MYAKLDLSNQLSLGSSEKTCTLDPATTTLRLLFKSPSNSRFANLYYLDASYTGIDLSIFIDCRDILVNLTELYLDGCHHLDPGCLYYLHQLPLLTHLSLAYCSRIDDSGLEILTRVSPNLQVLNASYLFRVTEKGVAQLARLAGLKTLILVGCYRVSLRLAYPSRLGHTHGQFRVLNQEL